MSLEKPSAMPRNVTVLPVVAATRALVDHSNGDHRHDDRGPQADCPSCKVDAA